VTARPLGQGGDDRQARGVGDRLEPSGEGRRARPLRGAARLERPGPHPDHQHSGQRDQQPPVGEIGRYHRHLSVGREVGDETHEQAVEVLGLADGVLPSGGPIGQPQAGLDSSRHHRLRRLDPRVAERVPHLADKGDVAPAQ